MWWASGAASRGQASRPLCQPRRSPRSHADWCLIRTQTSSWQVGNADSALMDVIGAIAAWPLTLQLLACCSLEEACGEACARPHKAEVQAYPLPRATLHHAAGYPGQSRCSKGKSLAFYT